MIKSKAPEYAYSDILRQAPTFLHENNERKFSNNFAIVGYLKSDYYLKLMEKSGSKGLFYFYKKAEGFIYPIHPDLAKCFKLDGKLFIGYTSKGFMLQAKIVGRTQSLKNSDLGIREAELGLAIKDREHKAQEYYVLELENIQEFGASSENWLKERIDKYPGNGITSEHSPKLIEWGNDIPGYLL